MTPTTMAATTASRPNTIPEIAPADNFPPFLAWMPGIPKEWSEITIVRIKFEVTLQSLGYDLNKAKKGTSSL